MGSKSNATTSDKTSTSNTQNVVDRRAVLEQGTQILDSVITSVDDKVVGKALAEVKVMFDKMVSGNTASVSQMSQLAEKLASMSAKNQIAMSSFGLDALEKARKELERLTNQGTFVLQIAEKTTDSAMNMAQQIARDQASNQRQALEIVAQSKAGDYSETLTGLSALIMCFALAAMYIAKGK